jgi:tRNA pseudouridine38-40 synthase
VSQADTVGWSDQPPDTAAQIPSVILTVSYDGTDYCGWQSQVNGPTIQAALERAVAKITGQRIAVTGSGRTDSGVHACGQVASFACGAPLSRGQWQRALNGRLPVDIRVLDVQRIGRRFDPIREALGKRYRYRLNDQPVHSVFASRYAWHVRSALDLSRMQEAGKLLIGEHDFASLQAAGSPRACTVRRIDEVLVCRDPHDADFVHIDVEANGFLYRMMRNIVGLLVDVGHGELELPDVVSIVAARDRKLASRTAPAHGLYLLRVNFPCLDQEQLADPAPRHRPLGP